jgi:hypothetical protein
LWRFSLCNTRSVGSCRTFIVGRVPLAVVVGTRDFTNACSPAAAFRLPDWRLLGSRRGDCGEQIRLALALLEDLGGGIILSI